MGTNVSTWIVRLRHRTGDERGQAAVEFALLLPILVVLLFATIQLGDAYWKWQQLSAATSEGARAAIVSAGEGDPEGVTETAVQDAAPNLDPAELVVTVTSTWESGEDVTVDASYPIDVNLLGWAAFSGTLDSSRTMRVE